VVDVLGAVEQGCQVGVLEAGLDQAEARVRAELSET
jgi:hypothetical protein